MKKKAIYAGSFDPITYGHLDIIKRASSLFESVVVVVMQNPEKQSLFTVKERQELIRLSCIDCVGIEVKSYEGLLVDFARQESVFTVIRGLRAVSDFDYECQMALTNREMLPELESVFLMTAKDYSFLSSSLVKQLAMYHADISSFVPDCVVESLRKKYE